MNLIELREVDSTNSYLERNARELPSPTLAVSTAQTAGRGQRGNSWEAAPGLNLTFSLLLRPALRPTEQFHISEAMALSICDMLEHQCGIQCLVKWPNDIYFGDKKICGILISHSLSGQKINYTVAGAGININQERFVSSAPNPVSVRQITGREFPLRPLLDDVARRIVSRIDGLSSSDPASLRAVHEEFKRRLWRGDSLPHRFRDVASGDCFLASIADIEPSGHILLRHAEGDSSGGVVRYAFKEVEWI